MQPGVVPGAVYEFHAARAAGGTGPGINSPLTTQAFDTSLNGNHGTLTNFSGTPWQGTGTAADPYRLAFNPTAPSDYVALPDIGAAEDKTITYEGWVIETSPAAAVRVVVGEFGPGAVTVSTAQINTYDGIPYFQIRDDAGTYVLLSAVQAIGSTMAHIVGTCDISNMRLYVNGAQVGTATPPPGGVLTLTSASVGCGKGGVYGWNGSILAARIYPFALTPARVAQNYAAGPLWTGPLGVPVLGGSPFILGGAV